MPIVQLGNHAALFNGEVLDGKRITTIQIPTEDPHHERMRTITHRDGLWPAVSDHAAPAWVVSDDPELERALALHWGCPIGNPGDSDDFGDQPIQLGIDLPVQDKPLGPDADQVQPIPDKPEGWVDLS